MGESSTPPNFLDTTMVSMVDTDHDRGSRWWMVTQIEGVLVHFNSLFQQQAMLRHKQDQWLVNEAQATFQDLHSQNSRRDKAKKQVEQQLLHLSQGFTKQEETSANQDILLTKVDNAVFQCQKSVDQFKGDLVPWHQSIHNIHDGQQQLKLQVDKLQQEVNGLKDTVSTLQTQQEQIWIRLHEMSHEVTEEFQVEEEQLKNLVSSKMDQLKAEILNTKTVHSAVVPTIGMVNPTYVAEIGEEAFGVPLDKSGFNRPSTSGLGDDGDMAGGHSLIPRAFRITPPRFSGRSDDDPELWINQLELQFELHRMYSDRPRILLALSLLDESACTWATADTDRQHSLVRGTWVEFCQALVDQFSLGDTVTRAKD